MRVNNQAYQYKNGLQKYLSSKYKICNRIMGTVISANPYLISRDLLGVVKEVAGKQKV